MCAALGAALVCAGSFTGSRAPASLIPTPVAYPAGVSAANDDGSRNYLPQAGYRYTYAFRREVKFEGDIGAALPKVDFTGEFHADILRGDARSFEAVLSEKIQGAPAPARPLLRIEAGTRGDSIEIFTLTGLTELEKQHAAVLKDLAAVWLFPLRTDSVGDYDARFDPETSGEKKTKIAYVSKAANTPTLLASEHHMSWSPAEHLPAEVRGRETTQLGKGQSALVATSAYELIFKSKGLSPAMDHAALAALQAHDTLALDTSHPNLAEHPDYAHLDWGKLMGDLKDSTHLSNSKQLALFGDVLKYLRLHPEKAADLASLLLDPALLKAGAASAEYRNIVGALATFATPEALTALRDAYADSNLAGPGKGMILSSLTTTQAALDVATRSFLAAEMQGSADARLSQGAAFALGSALQSAPNDEQSQQAVGLLSKNLAAAQTPAEQLAAIDVIGNSGRADFEPALDAVIQSNASAIVRARAVFALRFVRTTTAAGELVAALNAGDANLREAAANAIAAATWRETFRAPLSRCSSSESVARIQATCSQTLSTNGQVASAK